MCNMLSGEYKTTISILFELTIPKSFTRKFQKKKFHLKKSRTQAEPINTNLFQSLLNRFSTESIKVYLENVMDDP
jgi:hypothetical protein